VLGIAVLAMALFGQPGSAQQADRSNSEAPGLPTETNAFPSGPGDDPQTHYQGTHVRGERVKRESLQNRMRVTGNLRSHSIADVASQVPGRVDRVLVQEGDTVEEGDRLVILDTRRARKAMNVLEARKAVQQSIRAIRATELGDASADLEAYQRARESKQGVVSDQILREARTRVEVTQGRIAQVEAEIASIQAEIDELQVQIDDAVVVAPFKGVVVTRHAEEGEWLDTGDSVILLMELGELEAVLDVSERVPMNVLKALDRVSVKIRPLDLTVDSLSHRIIPDVEPRSRRYTVIARLPEQDRLAPGMSVFAYLPTNEKVLRTLVSSDALQRDQSGFFVYKVVPIGGELKAMPVGVSVDFSIKERVAVTASDLKEGDLIVKEGNVRLRPMQAVHVKDLATLMPSFVGALRAQQAEAERTGGKPGGGP
jgi:RND family efflux transporter MFP subunit